MTTLIGSQQVICNVLQTETATLKVICNVLQTLTNTKNIICNVLQQLTSLKTISFVVQDVAITTTCPLYPLSNGPAFSRIYVDYLTTGPTKVYWDLDRRFNDPLPYTFQLQVGSTGVANADDWANVGSSITNGAYLVDSSQRLYGKELTTNYRVILTTSKGTYTSQPTPITGNLNKRDWLIAREVLRKEKLRLGKYTAVPGILLKARRSGPICICVDTDTGEVTDSNCPDCYGTGFTGGYYSPLFCTYFDLSPDQRMEQRDLSGRGMTDDSIRTIRFVGFPKLYRYDVFINRGTDERYYVAEIPNMVEHRGVPLVVAARLRLVSFSDIIYTFPVNQ